MADFPSSDPAYPLFSIFAFLGFVLPLIPVTWQLQAWNTGAVYYVAWSSLSCLNFFVNSLVWKGNAINVAPVWCDISTRLMIGASVGLPAASLCINRRLYSISRVQVVTVTKKDKLRNILIDTCICVLFPIIYIALQFVVQGHRFNIFEDYGCVPSIVNTIPTFFIFTMWPLLIGIISAIYCVLSLWQFTKHRYRFTELLAGSQHANLTPLRYFRLMALACTELAFTIPLSIFIIWLNANATPISPWTGFSDAHFNFSRVETFLAIFWRSQKLMLVSMELTRWLNPFCSFVFFAFFGFGEEAMSRYRFAYNFLAKKAGLPSAGPEEKQRGIPSLSQLNLPKMSNDSSSSSATIIVPPSSGKTQYSPPPYWAYSPKSAASIMDVKIPSGHFSYLPPDGFVVPNIPDVPASPSTIMSMTTTSRFQEEDFTTHSVLNYYTRPDSDVHPHPHLPLSPASVLTTSTVATAGSHFMVPQLPPPPVVYGAETFSPMSPVLPPRRGWSTPSDAEAGGRPLTFPYPDYAPKGVRESDPDTFNV